MRISSVLTIEKQMTLAVSSKVMRQQMEETRISTKSMIAGESSGLYKDLRGLEQLRTSQNIELLKAMEHTQKEQRRLKN